MRHEYRLVADEIGNLAGVVSLTGVGTSWLMTFKPNQTRRWFAERFRSMITATETRDGRFFESLGKPPSPSRLRLLLHGNEQGAAVVQLTAPTYAVGFKSLMSAEQSRTLRRVAIALRRHELSHAELPDTLDALVPVFLEAEALRFADGRPVRYDRAARWIGWSDPVDLPEATTPCEIQVEQSP